MLFSYLKKRAVLRKRVSKLTRDLEKLSDSADLSTWTYVNTLDTKS